MQKKTTARHVGSWMVFFVTKCLICFFDRKTRFMPRSWIDFHCNLKLPWLLILVRKIHILATNVSPVFSNYTPCFPPDHVFSTRTACFPHPAFSKQRVFHSPGPRTPGPRTPYPETLAPRFPPNHLCRMMFTLYVSQTMTTRLLDCRLFIMNEIKVFSA